MPRDPETASYRFNHTTLRIKDPKVSLQFYQEILGMELQDNTINSLISYAFAREGILELTHNHGTESDANFQGYASGNTDPGRGFGHIAITVDDVEKACERFEKLNVPFKKRLTDGKMKNIAFILDPDGYWVEVVGNTVKL
ncbi:hypothetical protein Agabi119p4_5732 [Agaricus bisporus var. burnettii]|uniref:Lactoylglutathione lyase n=1 Tax=Agaricus bisporus var. burnettii TaxID=192524 RepID=A0A8H7F257_AGABI|nr:hypothetical protein Agabi119p4_5732 [Agaricus bisporus var. burnettii]